jgi:ankyrin repeat protein
MLAVQYACMPLIDELLLLGADVNQTDGNNFYAIQYVSFLSPEKRKTILDTYENKLRPNLCFLDSGCRNSTEQSTAPIATPSQENSASSNNEQNKTSTEQSSSQSIETTQKDKEEKPSVSVEPKTPAQIKKQKRRKNANKKTKEEKAQKDMEQQKLAQEREKQTADLQAAQAKEAMQNKINKENVQKADEFYKKLKNKRQGLRLVQWKNTAIERNKIMQEKEKRAIAHDRLNVQKRVFQGWKNEVAQQLDKNRENEKRALDFNDKSLLGSSMKTWRRNLHAKREKEKDEEKLRRDNEDFTADQAIIKWRRLVDKNRKARAENELRAQKIKEENARTEQLAQQEKDPSAICNQICRYGFMCWTATTENDRKILKNELIRYINNQDKELLRQARNADTQGSPLHITVFYGCLNAAKRLIELGADIQALDKKGVCAFYLLPCALINEENHEMIKLLKPLYTDRDEYFIKDCIKFAGKLTVKRSRLMDCIFQASQDYHKKLKEYGACIKSQQNIDGIKTALLGFVQEYKYISLLLRYSMNCNALMLAARYNCLPVANALIDMGINVQDKDFFGNTVLAYAKDKSVKLQLEQKIKEHRAQNQMHSLNNQEKLCRPVNIHNNNDLIEQNMNQKDDHEYDKLTKRIRKWKRGKAQAVEAKVKAVENGQSLRQSAAQRAQSAISPVKETKQKLFQWIKELIKQRKESIKRLEKRKNMPAQTIQHWWKNLLAKKRGIRLEHNAAQSTQDLKVMVADKEKNDACIEKLKKAKEVAIKECEDDAARKFLAAFKKWTIKNQNSHTNKDLNKICNKS